MGWVRSKVTMLKGHLYHYVCRYLHDCLLIIRCSDEPNICLHVSFRCLRFFIERSVGIQVFPP